MIYFLNTKEIDKFLDKEIWLVMRSVNGNLKKIAALSNVNIVHELAPPESLYAKFLYWKKNFKWDEGMFYKNFLPEYLKYIVNNYEALKKLNELIIRKDDEIYICCSCLHEKICHRLIIAGLLQLYNVSVKVENNNNLNKVILAINENLFGK